MEQINAAPSDSQEIMTLIEQRNAYHQAGRAVAICLRNKQKQLPAVHFQIIVKPQETDAHHANPYLNSQRLYKVMVEGGRLIQSLPLSLTGHAQSLTWRQQTEFRRAVEADVINLLAGSLAEAKYVALQDNEVFSANLVNFGALQYYGGELDLETITDYMMCLITDKEEREGKLAELFSAAYTFINKRTNWLAISALAEFIRKKPANIINCDEIIDLLKSRKAA